MARIHRLQPEPMTAESFAPYGEVLDAKERPGDARRFFPADFECDGRTTVDVIWQPQQGLRFSQLERHYDITQTFIPLGGAPSVVVVAPPTDLSNVDAIPAPDELRAFLIDPAIGYVYRRGTWHSLDRYLLAPPGASFVIINVDPNPTQVVDYEKRFDVVFEVVAAREPSRV